MSGRSGYSEGNWDKPIFQDRPTHFMNISDSIAQRLQTGTVDDERLKNHDMNWIEKLAEIDQKHTIEKNLDMEEIERRIQSLEAYTTGGIVTTCPADKRKIIECYTQLKGDTLKCESLVKDFIGCIDDLLYKATRIDERSSINITCPRKLTYRERFEKSCLNK